MNRIDWGVELAELGDTLPESDELWAYLRQVERRIWSTLGYPNPVL